MMEKNKERESEKQFPATAPGSGSRSSPRDLALTALIIIAVVALGLLAVNKFLDLRYKAELLSQPCDLCLKLNPRLEGCFDNALTVTVDKRTGKIINDNGFYNFNLSELEP